MRNMGKWFGQLFYVFHWFFLVFPLGMAVFLAGVYLDGGWADLLEGHDLQYYYLPELNHKVIVTVILIFLVLAVNRMIKVLSKWNSQILSGLCIAVVAAAIRLPLVYLFREDLRPFSDFSRVWNMAHGQMEGNIEYYSLFPAYLNFTAFLKGLVSVVPDAYRYLIYLNVLLASVTASAVYFIAKAVTEREQTGLAAGFLYVCMPSNIIYCTVGTPEFLTIAFDALGVLCLVNVIKKRGNWKYRILLMLSGGILTGIGSAYKSFGVIILIAFAAVFITTTVIEGEKRRYLLAAAGICLVFAGYGLAEGVIIRNTEQALAVSIQKETPYPHYFLIGLNTQGEGQISVGNLSRAYVNEYFANGFDADAARRQAFEILKADWQENPGYILPNFAKKMIWAWQDDLMPLYYFRTSAGLQPDTWPQLLVYRMVCSYLGTAGQFYYMSLLLLAAAGCFLYGRKREIYFRMDFCMLIIFGYFCLMLLSEAQSRYKCLILPYLCVLAAAGAAMVSGWIKTHFLVQEI